MTARGTMRQRTTVERKTLTATGGGGHTESWSTHLADLPCRCWYQRDDDTPIENLGDAPTAIVDHRVIVPKGSDVRVGDRLDQIEDRRGQVVFPGPLEVEAAGIRADHVELWCRTVD